MRPVFDFNAKYPYQIPALRFLLCLGNGYIFSEQAEAYRSQKRGLMQKLLTGEWRMKIKEDAA